MSDHSFRILIVGHEGCHNRGCEALVRTTIDQIKMQYPDAFFTLASTYPEHDFPLVSIPNLEIVPGRCHNFSIEGDSPPSCGSQVISKIATYFIPLGAKILLKKILPAYKRKNISSRQNFSLVRHLRKTILQSDAVFCIGGDVLAEDYGPEEHVLQQLEYAMHLNRKIVIWGASIWPYRDKIKEARLRNILRHSILCTVRDDVTLNYLKRLGIKDRVVLVGDGAFLMQLQHSNRTKIPWKNRPASLIGFTGSEILFGVEKHRSQGIIVDLIRFFRDLVDKHDYGIVFVPHDDGSVSRDREFLFVFSQFLDRSDKVYMPPIGLSAPETKAVIEQCDYFIGMRFHATVASLSQGIPTIGFSYSPKFAGLHQAVYGHTKYLIPFEEFTFEKINETFSELKKNRAEIKQHLTKRIPELQSEALTGLEYIKKIFS